MRKVVTDIEALLDKDAAADAARRYVCYMYLNAITVSIANTLKEYQPRSVLDGCSTTQEIVNAVNDRSKMSGLPLDMLESVCAVHRTADAIIQRSALDKSFWEGIALA